MIRYPQALNGVEVAVEVEAPGWLERAETRTAVFAELQRYTEVGTDAKKLTPFWGEVKPIFMRRQHHKCVYCETKLEGEVFAEIQWDLEHFRPKSRVRAWPDRKSAFVYDFPTGEASDSGYYLLAYHLHNYAAACKTCNSPFKSDYFPIAGSRVTAAAHPDNYEAEQPYLVYPLGSTGPDPEELITFDGVEAVPRPSRDVDESGWRRARLIIDFFGLNRDGLVAKRAWWLLQAVWPSLRGAEAGDATAVEYVDRACSARAPYASCSRCFIALYEQDRAAAVALIRVLKRIVDADST
jgi:hypothetical protein